MKIASSQVAMQSNPQFAAQRVREDGGKVWTSREAQPTQQVTAQTAQVVEARPMAQATVVSFSPQAQALAATRAAPSQSSEQSTLQRVAAQDHMELTPTEAVDAQLVQVTFHLRTIDVEKTERQKQEESSTAGSEHPIALPADEQTEAAGNGWEKVADQGGRPQGRDNRQGGGGKGRVDFKG